jgi:hypothetical protein
MLESKMNADKNNSIEPHDPLEAQVEVMVAEHLNAKLGSQVGRAAAAFQAQLQISHKEIHARELKRTRRTLYYFAIPAALAACIAVAATLMTGGKTPEIANNSKPAPKENPQTDVAKSPSVDSRTYYRDIDAGVHMVSKSDSGESMPVRQIRRQTVNETQWYDPAQHATMSITLPREEVVYVQIVPF